MPTSRPLIPRNKRNASKPDGFRLIQGSGPGFNPGGGRFNPGGDARTPSPGVTGTHKGTGVPGTPEYRPLIPRNKRYASKPDGFRLNQGPGPGFNPGGGRHDPFPGSSGHAEGDRGTGDA